MLIHYFSSVNNVLKIEIVYLIIKEYLQHFIIQKVTQCSPRCFKFSRHDTVSEINQWAAFCVANFTLAC